MEGWPEFTEGNGFTTEGAKGVRSLGFGVCKAFRRTQLVWSSGFGVWRLLGAAGGVAALSISKTPTKIRSDLCALCAAMIGILVFSRGLFPEELCLPDQSCSCSSSCSCSGSYQALPIQSLDGGHNREKDSNSQNEETSGGRRLRRASVEPLALSHR